MIDLQNWCIVPEALPGYKAEAWNPDIFQEVGDGKYGVYFYNLDEARMSDYYARVAIFQNQTHPVLLVQSQTVWIKLNSVVDGAVSVRYLEAPDCLLFRIPAYAAHSPKHVQPFLLLNLSNRLFAFIAWDDSSGYYSFQALDQTHLQVVEVQSEYLARWKGRLRTDEIISLPELPWYSLDEFDAAYARYHQEL